MTTCRHLRLQGELPSLFLLASRLLSLRISSASPPCGRPRASIQAAVSPVESLRSALLSATLAWFAVFEPGAVELAGAEPDEELRVASLVRRLGSDAFAEREAAEEQLATLGAGAREELIEATEHVDPEVRLRAKNLLRRLQVEELWIASKVRCQARQTTVSEALAMITEQTGNRVLAGDQYGAFHETFVDLEDTDGSFWETIDALCANSGNRVRPHYDTRRPGLVLAAGDPGRYPIARSGPVRMQMIRARRAFAEEFDYEQLDGEESHTFQFEMQAMWEDRFRLVAYRSHPELIEAVTDTGKRIIAAQAAASGWNIAGSGTRQVSMSLRLQPPPVACKELDSLRLKWGLVAVGDRATIEIRDFASTEPHFQDDVELVVQRFETGPGPRCELTLLVVRELAIPEPQDLIFEEIDVELFDADGKAFHRQGQSNSLTDQGAMLKLTFAGDSETSSPQVLRVGYPRIRAQKDLEIAFRRVPLPTARPE